MMYIGVPDFDADDDGILEGLSKNKRLGSYGALSSYVASIQGRYNEYKEACGDPWKLNPPLAIPASLANSLRAHYEGEVVGLEFISDIREKCRNDSCPMCGSTLPPVEVDHVIPKSEYPEFSFFSLNLVSACKCNQRKGALYKGGKYRERILHPYFDEVMKQRVVCLGFSGKAAKPEIQVKILPNYEDDDAVRFHVDNVLKKTAVVRHAENIWGKFSDLPRSTLRAFKGIANPIENSRVDKEIKELVRLNDYMYGTPNNWQSMFYFGLLDSKVHLNFIYERLREGY